MPTNVKFGELRSRLGIEPPSGSVGFLRFSDISSSIELIEPSTHNIWDTVVQNKWILGAHLFEMNPFQANSSIISLQQIFLNGFSANLDALEKTWSEISLHGVYLLYLPQ